MWTETAVKEEVLDCQPPYSFYFDLVERFWRSKKSNSLPFHRICTLARKQAVSYLTIESAADRSDVLDEIDALDEGHGGGGSAEAVAISYFRSDISPQKIKEVPGSGFLGQAILINYTAPGSNAAEITYIFEAILNPPAIPDAQGASKALLNNYLCVEGQFERTVHGRKFSLRGVYYCQQNGHTHVCAHASLRMALNSCHVQDPPVSSKQINDLLKLAPPCTGLSLGQLEESIRDITGVEASVLDCKGLLPQTYLSVLASTVKSGHVALLVFTTANNVEHVVTVFGYTRNSDEWHPQAIPAYAGPQSAQFYQSSLWIDHFLIHDDNFGPYYTLSTRSLDVDHPSVSAQWIIALYPISPKLTSAYAEAIAAIALANWRPSLATLGTGNWFDYMMRQDWQYVLRSILLQKETYIDHLKTAIAHDGSTMTTSELSLLNSLPQWIWMVEFSLPALYTGNRSKLGEFILDAQTSPNTGNPLASIAAARMPSLLLIWDSIAGTAIQQPTSLQSHISVFSNTKSEHTW